MKDTEFITKSLAYIQEIYDDYQECMEFDMLEEAKRKWDKYITCSMLLEEVTGLEVCHSRHGLYLADPDRDLLEDEETDEA